MESLRENSMASDPKKENDEAQAAAQAQAPDIATGAIRIAETVEPIGDDGGVVNKAIPDTEPAEVNAGDDPGLHGHIRVLTPEEVARIGKELGIVTSSGRKGVV